MSWMRSGTKLSQILRVFLPTFAKVHLGIVYFYTNSVVLVLVCCTSGPGFKSVRDRNRDSIAHSLEFLPSYCSDMTGIL